MADEQIIYLSPEEDLTTVRERLERAHAQRIILIIPPQTQLRSNVSWRLLHARARALSKDVLVISSDRQIRSVVKAAGFRVAESQESPPSARTRPGSRPGRSGAGGKTGTRFHAVPGRRSPEDRGSSTDVRIPQREQPASPDLVADEKRLAPQEPASRPEEISADQVTHPSSPTFEEPGQQFGPGYDFSIKTSPPLGTGLPPAMAEQELDEHASLVEDYNFTQSIREAAQLDEAETVTEPPEAESVAPAVSPQPHDTAPPTRDIGDPFSLMEDRQSVRLPEQRGAAPIDELDTGVPDISGYPTDVIANGEIEDLGDEGNVVQPDPLAEPIDEDATTEVGRSSRNYGMQPRSRRQSILPEDEEDALPPIQGIPSSSPVRPSMPLVPAEPTRAFSAQPPNTPRPGVLSGSSRVPARSRPAAPAQSKTTRRTASGIGTSRPATVARPARTTAARRSSRSIVLIPIIVIVLLLIAGFAYGYFVPTADVTITLPSQNFRTPLTLTAATNSQQDAVQQTVRAQVVTFDPTLSKTGSATGSKQVGTTPATGQVVFTNHGSQSVDIPNGTIIATTSGVQYMTTSDVLVPTVGSNIGNAIPDPVQALNPGTSGNVAANSITVIPTESLSKITQANGNAQPNVSVTNPVAITNGGVGNATAVTPKDIQILKTALVQQLQQQAKAWLAKQVQNGDVAGQPVQKVTDIATPATGQVASNGTVTEQVSLHMTVLIVRAADLQAVAQAVFNTAAGKAKPNFALAPGQRLSLTKAAVKNCTPSTGTTSLTLCYMASGQITPQIPMQQVRDALTGKTVKDATDYLTSITTSAGNVSTPPVITIQPSFFPLLPFLSQHITLHVNRVPAQPAPKK